MLYHIDTSTTYLHQSILPYRNTCIEPPDLRTSASLHLYRGSRPPNARIATPSPSVQASEPPHRYPFVEPLDLQTSTSLYLYRDPGPPNLPVATPLSSLE